MFALKEMEFPHLGEHCSEPSCHTLGNVEIVYKKASIQVHLLFEKFELRLDPIYMVYMILIKNSRSLNSITLLLKGINNS